MIVRRVARGRRRGPSPYPTTAARWWRSAGALLVLVVFLPPLLLLVVGSLHEPGQPPPPTPQLRPDPLSVEGYSQAVDLGDLLRVTLNSLLVAAITVPASVLVASLAGFALSQVPRR